jgi:hypothetical protein
MAAAAVVGATDSRVNEPSWARGIIVSNQNGLGRETRDEARA